MPFVEGNWASWHTLRAQPVARVIMPYPLGFRLQPSLAYELHPHVQRVAIATIRGCQWACKIDPLRASKINPPVHF